MAWRKWQNENCWIRSLVKDGLVASATDGLPPIAQRPKSLCNGIARYAVLRWSLNQDWWLLACAPWHPASSFPVAPVGLGLMLSHGDTKVIPCARIVAREKTQRFLSFSLCRTSSSVFNYPISGGITLLITGEGAHLVSAYLNMLVNGEATRRSGWSQMLGEPFFLQGIYPPGN